MNRPRFSEFHRSFALAAALFTVAFAGCLHSVSPNVDTMICQSDDNCPSGYVCAIKGQPGGCRKSGGGVDGSTDGPYAGGDVPIRLDGEFIDTTSGSDGSIVPDSAPDIVIGGQDLPSGRDLPNGQPDGAPPLPEVQPDVASGPEVSDATLESHDAPADLPVDQPLPCNGGCCTSADCPPTAPVCNSSNQCTKCGSDNDCSGRSATACNTTSGACVQCTKSGQCGTTGVCDTSTNKCVGCTQRSDCPGACQTCSGGSCVAVKGADDTTKCAGTCDSNGECKAKAGQKCDAVAAGCITGTTCADGYCCNRACTGTCEACDLATSPGTCSVLPANTTARHGSCSGTGTCTGTCQGKPDGTCTFPTGSCGTAGCPTTTSSQAVGTCNGAGTCSMPDPVPCKTGATCSAANCSCPQGTEDCGSSGCINTAGSDANHCGSCTTVCGPNQYCSSGNCSCSLGANVCGGCLGWNFESGTQNWLKDSNPNVWLGTPNGAQTPTTSTTTVCPGSLCPGSTRALQVSMSMDMTTTSSAGIAVPLCVSGGTTEMLNRTISMQVYFDGTADFGVLSAMFAKAWGSGGDIQCNLKWGTDMTMHNWFPATCTFVDSFLANHIAIQVNNSGSPWSGTMYIDNVQIN